MAIPAWFKVAEYKANKLAQLQAKDVAGAWDAAKMDTAFSNAGFGGEEGAYKHFVQFGANENVAPNSLFNVDQYRIAKAAQWKGKAAADVTVADLAALDAAFTDAGLNAWTHYQKFGSQEGINPSNSFDESAYFEAKLAALKAAEPAKGWTDASMKAAFKAAGLTALQHFMMYGGKGAGEVAATTFPVPVAEQVPAQVKNPGSTFSLTAGDDVFAGTAKDDEITGTDLTYNSGDMIIDSSTTDRDTLTITSTAAAISATPNVANIENINFDFSTYGDTSVNVTSIKNGVITVNQKLGVGSKVATVTNAHKDVSVVAGTGIETLKITSKTADENIKIDSGAATTIALTGTAGADSATIKLNGQGDLTAAGVTVSKIGTLLEALTLNSTTSDNVVTLNGYGGGEITKITATGDKSLTVKAAQGAAAASAVTGADLIDSTTAGTTTLALTLEATQANTEDLTKVKFDVIDVSGAAHATDKIQVATGATVKAGALTAGALQIEGVLGTAATNTLNLIANGDQGTGITVTNTKTVNLSAAKASNLKTGVFGTATVLLSGTNDITLGTNSTAGEVKAGADFTGKLNVKLSAGNLLKATGGSSDDTFTIADAADYTIVGGGGNDVVTLGAVYLKGNTLTLDSIEAIKLTGAATFEAAHLSGKSFQLYGHNVNVEQINGINLDLSHLSGDETKTITVTVDNAVKDVAQTVIGSNAHQNTLNLSNVTKGSTITGGKYADTITGGTGDDVIYSGGGADVITGGNGKDTIHLVAGDATRQIIIGATANASCDTIIGFAPGSAATNDQFKIALKANNTALGDGDAATLTTHSESGNLTMSGHVAKITVEKVTTFSTNGDSVLDALVTGAGSGTITAENAADTLVFLVENTAGDVGVYYASTIGNTDVANGEIALVGVLKGVALSNLTGDNFIGA